MSMKLQSAIIACFLCASPAAFTREFVDTQGRKLEGDLVAVSGGLASIKRSADGRLFQINSATLSEADQQFIAAFAAQNVRHDFEVKSTKTKLGKTKSKEGVVTVETEEWAYKLALTNRSTGDLSGLRVDYWLFRRDDDGKNKLPPRVETSGRHEIAAIRRGASQEMQTRSFTLTKEQLQADYFYQDGARNTRRDSAGGVALRIYQGDKEVFAWGSDNDLLALAKGTVETSASQQP